jgi:hypothetical protein
MFFFAPSILYFLSCLPQVFYEDLLLDGDATHAELHRFLNAGPPRMAREFGEAEDSFAKPTVPDHLVMAKQTPHDLCEAVRGVPLVLVAGGWCW